MSLSLRNIFASSILALFLAGVALPSGSSALTVAEIQAQIQQLLAQISFLSSPGASVQTGSTGAAQITIRGYRVCGALYRNLYVGTRGDDVFALQEYLRVQGFLTVNPTGYFGLATQSALARWQASQGISAVGALGPLTRARIQALCGQSGGGGGPIACTAEYAPVCGRPRICDTPGIGAYPRECDNGQTFSNRCQMSAAGATFLYDGQCRTQTTDPSNDPRCRSWYDGCNNCSREYPGGPAACTLRACVWQPPAYCTSYFPILSTNRPPTVSSFSGPTTLQVNQTGTWSIQASDPENQQLGYFVTWGDEYTAVPYTSSAAGMAFVQTTAFTHSYASAGTYTITIAVRDSSGQEAHSSTTVRVEAGPTYCTLEYAPVCGAKSVCPACYYSQPACLAPCQIEYKTYSNRCFMSADGATFVHQGVCAQ